MAGKTIALITGANKGIGLAIAPQLGEREFSVWLGARDPDRGEAAASGLRQAGVDARAITLDVAVGDSVAQAAGRLKEEAGVLDVLVNNAGISVGSPPPGVTEEAVDDVRAMFEVNTLGPLRVTQALLPLLRKSAAPRVVMMSSGLGSISDSRSTPPIPATPPPTSTATPERAPSRKPLPLPLNSQHLARWGRPAASSMTAMLGGWPATGGDRLRRPKSRHAHSLPTLMSKEVTMTHQALSTLPREAKGPLAPPPMLGGSVQAVADAIATWPEVQATTHWHLNDQTRIDGIDFYVGPDELGHIHLDGSIHLATTPELGAEMVAEGLGKPFRWARGWITADISRLGVDAAEALFRRNYDRLRPGATGAQLAGSHNRAGS